MRSFLFIKQPVSGKLFDTESGGTKYNSTEENSEQIKNCFDFEGGVGDRYCADCSTKLITRSLFAAVHRVESLGLFYRGSRTLQANPTIQVVNLNWRFVS